MDYLDGKSPCWLRERKKHRPLPPGEVLLSQIEAGLLSRLERHDKKLVSIKA